MKVLFVSSGNSSKGISSIVKAQGASLESLGIQVDYYTIIGHGILGYLKNVPRLRQILKQGKYDLVHAHYSFCGITSSVAAKRAMVVSLMGSDVKSSGIWRCVLRIFVKRIWSATIVKSEDMKKCLGLDCIHVIPNGVDLNEFRPLDKYQCRAKLGWNVDKDIVLFAADPSRFEKNYSLAEEAVKHIKRDDVLLKVVNNVQHSDMPLYLNAADILVLTSSWEGSPNVVKEAMSCNTKIVAVKVGDIPWLLDGLENCYVTSHDPIEIAGKIHQALQFIGTTNGRERLVFLGLDSESIAIKIIELYQNVLDNRKLWEPLVSKI